MTGSGNGDFVLSAIGLLVVLWCSGLVLYAVGSARREARLSLEHLAEAFAVLLIGLGERLRQSERSKAQKL